MFVCIAVDNVLQRMTIVGVLLSFRSLAQEALLDVCIVCCVQLTLMNDLILKRIVAFYFIVLVHSSMLGLAVWCTG